MYLPFLQADLASRSQRCPQKLLDCMYMSKPTPFGPCAGEHRWKLLTTLSGYHDRTIFSVDWSRDGLIATGCADNAIRIFAEAGGEVVQGVRDLFLKQAPSFSMACKREQAHSIDVNCVRWHPTEPGLLASAGDDCMIKIWQYQPSQS
jgi:WD40 repeat protein